jgi:competence protein ComEC
MNDRYYFRPLIPLLLALMAGILMGSRYPGFVVGFALLAVVCGASILVCIYLPRSAFYVAILLMVSLGYLSIQPWLSPRIPANHIRNYTDSHRWNIFGQIDNQPSQISNRTKFDLRVATLDADNKSHAVSGLLRVTVVGEPPNINMGDKIHFYARMRSITNFKNPGGFDYKRYMVFKGILATAYVRADNLRIIKKSRPTGMLAAVNRVRSQFAHLVGKAGSPEVQGVLKALIIGDRTQIFDTTRQAFNRAGVAHLLAISGLHVGIVATVAFAFFNWLTGWNKALLRRAWTRKSAALISLVPVITYGMVAGLSPSTQRAVLMVSVFLMTFLLSKEQDSTNTLALAALVILMADPPALFSISFQLSFTTVFAIIYGFSAIQNLGFLQPVPENRSWPERMGFRLVAFFWVSLFAIGGSLPLVAFYFNQISLVGLAANFLVVPLVGFIAIPLGLAAFFLTPLSTTLALGCLKAGSVSLAGALDIIKFFAHLPFAAVKTITPSILEVVCYYILGWAVLNLIRPSPSYSAKVKVGMPDDAGSTKTGNGSIAPRLAAAGGARRLPSRKWARIGLILTLLILAADSCYWLYQRFWHPDLRVTIIDVGNGSAALLEIPGGRTIMIDGGGFSDHASFDVGSRIIAPLLWQKKIMTVDLLILSHPNSDHLNGLIYLADHFNVKSLWSNGEPRSTKGYRKLMQVCDRRGIHLPAYADMDHEYRLGGVHLELLYPPRDFLDRQEPGHWRNSNNNSLVVKVAFADTSFLFPGDIMAAAEEELMSLADDRLASTVLIVPHHGSRSSSSQQFIQEVNPQAVVVSCGRNSRFKFPHHEVLDRYRDLGADIFRTDINGAVQLTSDGQHVMVKPFVPNPSSTAPALM